MLSKKRILALVLSVLILVLHIPFGASAANLVTQKIAQLDLKISIPEGWLYADRGATDDSSFCQAMKLSAKQYIEKYLSDDCYLTAFDTSTGIYLTLTVKEPNCDDYSNLNDDEITSLYSWLALYEDRLVSCRLLKFNKTYFEYVVNDGQRFFSYDTVFNGKKYTFTFMGADNVEQNTLETFYDNIIQRVTYPVVTNTGKTELSSNVSDPVLSLFPGLEWGMTNEDMVKKYGTDKVIDLSHDGEYSAISTVDLYDDGVMVMFGFDGNKLDSITAIFTAEKAEYYYTDLIKAYGNPVKTSSVLIRAGMIDDLVDNEHGDVYLWRTDNFLVYLTGVQAGSLEYRPLK